MFINKKLLSLLLVCTVLLLSSCEDFFESTVELELPETEQQLVANCVLNVGERIAVTLSHSVSILSEIEPGGGDTRIENAIVSIYADGTLLETLPFVSYLQDGNMSYFDSYVSSSALVVEAGKVYTLEASAAGYPEIKATGFAPAPVEIESIALLDPSYLALATDETYAEFAVTFDDPDAENFYALSFQTCSEENCYLNCIYSLDGTFGAGSGDLFEGEIDCKYGSDSFFRDLTFEGDRKELKFFLEDYYLNVIGEQSQEIVLSTLSKDFYLYSKSFELQQNRQDNPFAEPVQVYNNIENGFGNFSGLSSRSIILPTE